jgi:hypothetical protein
LNSRVISWCSKKAADISIGEFAKRHNSGNITQTKKNNCHVQLAALEASHQEWPVKLTRS